VLQNCTMLELNNFAGFVSLNAKAT